MIFRTKINTRRPDDTEDVHKVVLQKSVAAQNRELIFDHDLIKDKLTDLCGN